MKNLALFSRSLAPFALAVFSFLAFAASAPAVTSKAARPVRLQIEVVLPPSMSPIWADDVGEAFGWRLATSLHEQGLHGRIKMVPPGEEPAADLPLLTATLIRWRVDRMGSVDCTFTARLRTPAGEKNLGAFYGQSIMAWADHDWMSRADSYTDAATDAMTDLWKRIQQTGLLPDNPPATR